MLLVGGTNTHGQRVGVGYSGKEGGQFTQVQYGGSRTGGLVTEQRRSFYKCRRQQDFSEG
eukprot:768456-Hanusia_phi.AAC.9